MLGPTGNLRAPVRAGKLLVGFNADVYGEHLEAASARGRDASRPGLLASSGAACSGDRRPPDPWSGRSGGGLSPAPGGPLGVSRLAGGEGPERRDERHHVETHVGLPPRWRRARVARCRLGQGRGPKGWSIRTLSGSRMDQPLQVLRLQRVVLGRVPLPRPRAPPQRKPRCRGRPRRGGPRSPASPQRGTSPRAPPAP